MSYQKIDKKKILRLKKIKSLSYPKIQSVIGYLNSNIMNFILKMKEAKMKLINLAEYLTNKGINYDLNNTIQIRLKDDFRLSICSPLDALDYFETMLLKNDSCFYDEDSGYEDICRFETYDKVYEEILRVQDYFTSKEEKKEKEKEEVDLSSIMNIILKMNDGKKKIDNLAEYLTNKGINYDLNNTIQITLIDDFRLSICSPLDAPDYFETMLLKNDNCFYDKDCSYEDVCRFESYEEVYEEILRVQDYFDNKYAGDKIILKPK